MARVSLNRTQMQVDDRVVHLTPGMAVTVEIKTGSRRLIEYLLSPLLQVRSRACANADALLHSEAASTARSSWSSGTNIILQEKPLSLPTVIQAWRSSRQSGTVCRLVGGDSAWRQHE